MPEWTDGLKPDLLEQIKAKLAELEALVQQAPDSRYRALALTQLELVGMWLAKAIP